MEDKTEEKTDTKMETKEVFVPAENISERKRAEKLREKIETQKEKHRMMNKLKSVKRLADSDEEDESALEWYQKQKKLEKEKRLAEQKAKLLAEMDQEIEEAHSRTSKTSKANAYSSKHLAGLAIGHKMDSIKEGQQVVLTLRDNDVLNEDDEDVLENVDILAEEKTNKNLENKKQKPDYKPYDDDEFDEFGIIKPRSLLSKYDEEIDGPKAEMFRIGQFNNVPSSSKASNDVGLDGRLKLTLPDMKVASEYYTADEMVKFKKPSKRKGALRKKSKKGATSEEMIKLEPESSSASVNHGSRSKRSKANDGSSVKKVAATVKLDLTELDDDEEDDQDYDDLSGIRIEEDLAQKELYSALNKARKLKSLDVTQKMIDPAANIAKMVETIKQEIPEEEEMKTEDDFDTVDHKNLVLNATAEFCRNLGELPKFNELAQHRKKVLSDDEDDEDQKGRPMDIEPGDGDDDYDDRRYRNNWNEVELKEEEEEDGEVGHKGETSSRFVSQPILEEEPDVSIGVAGALKLAMTKGYLDKETKKVGGASSSSNIISAQAYTIEEKFHDDERGNRRDRYSNLSDFKEKDTYKPTFKLDYVDEKGRVMTPKESFRYLSHKFHGKGPGKNKIDKRMKKMEQESVSIY